MSKIYNILEVANTHGGNIFYISSLLEEFIEFDKTNGFGIKFQPFKYDLIATKDFTAYGLYKQLYIKKSDWKKIINSAYKTKDIWIDIFDLYGVSIVEENIDKIFGIKLQSSVLENLEVYSSLKNIDISNLKLIINIAGRNKKEIQNLVEKYENLNPHELLIEVGFQAYPTELVDSGLAKIKYIKQNYQHRVVFADHTSGVSKEAISLPLVAMMIGADYIEKHIKHSILETKYDYFSSVSYTTYKKIIEDQNNFFPLLGGEFINDSERKYLLDSYQIPILKNEKTKSSCIDLEKDFSFRRSNQSGLNISEISNLISDFHVLKSSMKAGVTLKPDDFRKAKVAAIIACRLKSSRLPKKATLAIGDLTSIEHCIKNTLRIKSIEHVILATSDNKQDSELANFTYDKSVIFHQGSPEDVIDRYLNIINKLKIDVFIRITGDMPFVSSEIAEYLLEEHFKTGAEYTVANKVAVGTSVEIISTSALKKVKKFFPSAEYSEYMTWYFQNNPNYFSLNFVDLPKKWIRDYRLTLDYEDDLEMFILVDRYFKMNKIDFSIEELFKFLDNNPNIASMNSHISLIYKTDKKLIKTLNKKTKIFDSNKE